MTYTVREASAEDVAALVPLLNEIDDYYGDETTDTERLRTDRVRSAVTGTSPDHVVVARADHGPMVGMVSCSFLWPAEGSNSSLYMKELYVSEGHRRHGIGRMLFEHVCELARKAGCTRVEWTAEQNDKVSAAFYASIQDCEAVTTKVFYRKLVDGTPSPT